jgi:hypothetical protein
MKLGDKGWMVRDGRVIQVQVATVNEADRNDPTYLMNLATMHSFKRATGEVILDTREEADALLARDNDARRAKVAKLRAEAKAITDRADAIEATLPPVAVTGPNPRD